MIRALLLLLLVHAACGQRGTLDTGKVSQFPSPNLCESSITKSDGRIANIGVFQTINESHLQPMAIETIDNFDPGGTDSVLLATPVILTGIASGAKDNNDRSVEGRLLQLWNCSSNNSYISFERMESHAANRIAGKSRESIDILIPPGYVDILVYRTDPDRWLQLQGPDKAVSP